MSKEWTLNRKSCRTHDGSLRPLRAADGRAPVPSMPARRVIREPARRTAAVCAAPFLALACVVAGVVPTSAQDVAAIARDYIPRLERNLTENVMKFWSGRCLDTTYGGYVINFGPSGEPNGLRTKMIVTQARMVWLFARLARAGYEPRESLQAASHGYRFLKDKMWDATNGGFFWEVDQTGEQKLKPNKHLYGQAFGLYALSEYYLATRNEDALAWAVRLFEVLEQKAHDQTYGGYVEFFNEDWTPAPAAARPYVTGSTADRKLMNTHLHLLEAMTAFYRASKLPLARERVIELINIESNAVVRKGVAACTDQYERTWTPRLDGDGARVNYGHDLENIYLLIDAGAAVGMSTYPFTDLYRAVFDYSLKYGHDADRGGFYESGLLGQPADRRNKVWWVQAEAVVSALYMYRLTNDPIYLAVFRSTYDWIEKYQTDWVRGEWYYYVTPDGQGQGDKGTTWKAGYHNGRAMIEGLALLRQMSR